jgi:CheY-like chemotaxis protein
VLQPKVLDLNAVVSDTEAILRRLVGEDVALTAELDPALALVRADPGQIGQVLLNLAVNARDAMPAGGRLTISTSNADIHEAEARHLSLDPGGYVAITVRDTGDGMDEETQERIFEPFFTTKQPGRGTGLGLATVYGIVAQSGGSICVRSALGEGTTFTVFLPRLEAGVLQQQTSAPEPAASKGVETVLLVEDENAVRTLLRDVLADGGYTVLEARDADEALALCAGRDGRLDAVVTDVVMPVMSGPALVARLALARPALKVIYMSGYTDEAVARDGVLDPGAAFLQKPFGMDVLLRTLRDVLDNVTEPRRSGLKEVA